MTEAGEKWVYEWNEFWRTDTRNISTSEFWIRAFVDEVEKRALDGNEDLYRSEKECIGWTFENLKRELLGEESK